MKTFKIIVLMILTLNTSRSMSQNLASHLWENRVLLVLTEDSNDVSFQNQIQALQSYENGLADRKLLIYQIKKHSFKIGLKHNEWQNSTKLYEKYKDNNTLFEVILIGLDGDVKLKQSKLLTCDTLFSTIDVMPMRKEELKNKKN